MAITNTERRLKIKRKLRRKIFGTEVEPRLSVFRSNTNIYAQVIDDTKGNTLVSVSSKKMAKGQNITKSQLANQVGTLLAQKLLELKIDKVKFDRNGYLYHGRVKALAEGARNGGLKF